MSPKQNPIETYLETVFAFIVFQIASTGAEMLHLPSMTKGFSPHQTHFEFAEKWGCRDLRTCFP